jgi:hypothetical protein
MSKLFHVFILKSYSNFISFYYSLLWKIQCFLKLFYSHLYESLNLCLQFLNIILILLKYFLYYFNSPPLIVLYLLTFCWIPPFILFIHLFYLPLFKINQGLNFLLFFSIILSSSKLKIYLFQFIYCFLKLKIF